MEASYSVNSLAFEIREANSRLMETFRLEGIVNLFCELMITKFWSEFKNVFGMIIDTEGNP